MGTKNHIYVNERMLGSDQVDEVYRIDSYAGRKAESEDDLEENEENESVIVESMVKHY